MKETKKSKSNPTKKTSYKNPTTPKMISSIIHLAPPPSTFPKDDNCYFVNIKEYGVQVTLFYHTNYYQEPRTKKMFIEFAKSIWGSRGGALHNRF